MLSCVYARKTQRASLELRGGFLLRINSGQHLSGLQTPLLDEQEVAPQEGKGQEFRASCMQPPKHRVQWGRCPCPSDFGFLWGRRVGCSVLQRCNRVHVRLFSSGTNLRRAAANSSLDAALGRALWTVVVMLSLNIPPVCLPGLKCY